MKYIIPCAGFGTRMGMEPNKSKEMLIDPSTGNRLIDLSLRYAYVNNATPHVITRAEKTDLIEYLASKKISTQIIVPEGEWADTVLTSEPSWDDHNILVLPDTTWSPGFKALREIEQSLFLGASTVFALHQVTDISKWGSIDDYGVTEKSSEVRAGYAWGLIGFNKRYGHTLFTFMTTRDYELQLHRSSFVFLDSFKDLTRTGRIVVGTPE